MNQDRIKLKPDAEIAEENGIPIREVIRLKPGIAHELRYTPASYSIVCSVPLKIKGDTIRLIGFYPQPDANGEVEVTIAYWHQPHKKRAYDFWQWDDYT